MAHATTLELSTPALNDVLVLARSFELSLRARNRSPETIKSYVGTVEMFGGFLLASGFPTSIDRMGREHVEWFIADQLARWKPKTARIRYGNLQQFFKWCLEEGEITDTPMKNVETALGSRGARTYHLRRSLAAYLQECGGHHIRAAAGCRHFTGAI